MVREGFPLPLSALYRLSRHAARGRLEPAGYDLDQRRLAGAIVAEQPDNFSSVHVQAHVIDCDQSAKVLVQVFRRQNRLA